MTYYVTALTNDRAKLIVSETRTTDAAIAEMVRASLAAQDYVVTVRTEG